MNSSNHKQKTYLPNKSQMKGYKMMLLEEAADFKLRSFSP